MRIISSLKSYLRNTFVRFVQIYESRIRYLDGSLGESLRFRFYRKRLGHIGNGSIIDTGVFFRGSRYIFIGDRTHIDKNCIIVGSPRDLDLSARIVKRRDLEAECMASGEVRIGSDCHISQNCMIYGYGGVFIGDNCVMSAGAKVYSLTSMAYNPFDPSEIVSIMPYSARSPTLMGKVVLENNTWIGIDSVVSPGVRIGANSFVRSYAMVMDSFSENSYIAGDPAIKTRDRYAQKEEH